MPKTQPPALEDILKPSDMGAFNALYNTIATDVSSEESGDIRALCAQIYTTQAGQKALQHLVDKNVKLSTASEIPSAYDEFGTYLPERSFLKVDGLLSNDKKNEELKQNAKDILDFYKLKLEAPELPPPTFMDAVEGLQKRMEHVARFNPNQPVHQVFCFKQAVDRGDTSQKFYDFMDKNDVAHLVLIDQVKRNEKRKNSIIAEITVPNKKQENADKLLLRTYEASQRSPVLKPRYYRALQKYAGENANILALKKYESIRNGSEVKKAEKQSFSEKTTLAVRSWLTRNTRS